MLSLDGKIAIVTGGAMGIGSAIAAEFLDCGCSVMIADHHAEAGGATVQALQAQGRQVAFVPCDVRDTAAVYRAVEETGMRFGPVDIVVNNAGIGGPIRPITEQAEDDWLDVFDTNVHSIYRFCRATFDGFRDRGGGCVINLASVHQARSRDGYSAYAASKGAIVSLTRQLAAEWGQYNIRVNSISPGAIDTERMRRGLEADTTGESERKLMQNHALGRLGRPAEVAKTAAFLASDGAAFITGEDILVDGGLTMMGGLQRGPQGW